MHLQFNEVEKKKERKEKNQLTKGMYLAFLHRFGVLYRFKY